MSNQGDNNHYPMESGVSLSDPVTIVENFTGSSVYLQQQQELSALKKKLFFRIQANSHNQTLQQAFFEILELAFEEKPLLHFYHSLHLIVRKLLFVEDFRIALLNEQTGELELIDYGKNSNKDIVEHLESSSKESSNGNSIENQSKANNQYNDGAIYKSMLDEKSLIYFLFKLRQVNCLNKVALLELINSKKVIPPEHTPSSSLSAPIIINTKVVGVIVAQSYDDDVIFQGWHHELIGYVAQTISSALVRAKHQQLLEKEFVEKTKVITLEVEKRQAAQKIEKVLLDISNLANSKIALSDFYTELHKNIATLVYAENFYIVLRKPSTNEIEFVYFVDTKDKTTISELGALPYREIKKSLTGMLFDSGKSILTNRKGLAELAASNKIEIHGPKSTSWLGVPLNIDDATIGVLVLQAYDGLHVFSNQDVQLMEYISQPVANTIQRKSAHFQLESLVENRTKALRLANHQLIQQIDKKTKAEKLQSALYDIASLASSAEDMNGFYSKLHEILRQLFYAENFYIGVAENNNQVLSIKYARDEKDNRYFENLSFDINSNTLTTRLFRENTSFLLNINEFNQLANKYHFDLIGSVFESWLGVTLKENNEPVGVMVIQSYRPDEMYQEWHRALLEFVAQHVTIALHRKKDKDSLEQKVLQRTEELEKEIEERKTSEASQSALYLIANLANKDLELIDFYRELHNIIATLLYSENFYIAIKDDDSENIKMAYYVDTMDDLDIYSISALPAEKLKKSLTGHVMNSGQSYLGTIDDIKALTIEHNLEVIGTETVSWLGVPLIIEGSVIGIMTLQSYTEDFHYTEKDRELMLFVGQHVASSLQRKKNRDYLKYLVEQRTQELNASNEQLKKQVQVSENAKKLQIALFQITELAASAESMDRLYSSIHKIISQLIYANNFYICLYDKLSKKLDFVYFVDTEDSLDIESVKQYSFEDIRHTGTGRVLLEGRSILRTSSDQVNSLYKSSTYVGKKSLYWLGVPLKSEAGTIGLIAIQSYRTDKPIGVKERDLLEYVSQHIASTLERKQNQNALELRVVERTAKLAEINQSLKTEVKERKHSEAVQAALYEISGLANTASSLQELFAQVHQVIETIIYARNFYLCIWNKQKNDMDWVYFVDADQDFDYSAIERLPIEGKRLSLAKLVFDSQKVLHIDKQRIFDLQDNGEIVLMGPASEYYLGVPLISTSGPIGVMAVQSYKRELKYSTADEALLAFVAQSIVSVIERHEYHRHLEQSVEVRTQELTVSNQLLQQEIQQRKEAVELQRALFKISETPQMCVTENELYTQLHKIISRMMFAKSFYIAWADKENNQFRMKYVVDEYDKMSDSINFDQGLTGYVYRCGEITHLCREDILALEAENILVCIGTVPTDWVGVPLISGGEILGIMALQSYNENYVYGNREIDILNFVSTHIAEALQRKYAENKLSQAYLELAIKTAKAEEASKAKSTFLATVSHEIRTPMNGILGMLSLLNETALSAKQLDYVSKIAISARSLLGIINDILDFSKIEQGKLELERLSFSLLEVIDNITDIFAAKVNEKKLEFSINLEPNVQLERVGDSLRLNQILINLVGNAIKFTWQGFVRITISEPNANELHFSVEDSGIGIAANKREKIFQSFTQADDATTRKFGGSGLGLSICQQLITLMQGNIEVTGMRGKGSCFSFKVKIDRNLRIKTSFLKSDNIRILLLTSSSIQTLIWKNFALRYHYQIDIFKLKEIHDLVENNKLQTMNPSHVFIDFREGMEASLRLNKLSQAIASISANCYLLAQPYSNLFDDFKDIKELPVISKPLKMSEVMRILTHNSKDAFPERHKPAIVSGGQLKGLRILLVEDNLINQQVAREILEKAGAKVSIANQGKQAVRLVGKEPFDLALMDIQMPIMDGYTATKIIRRKVKLTDLPIVAMTANVMKGDREKCLQAGMNGYIGKPIEKLALFKVIKNALKNRHTLALESDLIKAPEQTKESDLNKNQTQAISHSEAYSHKHLSINQQLADVFEKFGDRSLVVDLLRMFVDVHSDDGLAIEKSIAADKLEDASKRIHKLKGSCGELSMQNLYDEIVNMEACLKKKRKPSSRELSKLSLKLAEQVNRINEFLQDFETT